MSSVHESLNNHFGCSLNEDGNVKQLRKIKQNEPFPSKHVHNFRHHVAMIHSEQLPVNTLVPFSRGNPTKSRGSGFFVNCGGELHIMTNHHVVNESCSTAFSLDSSAKQLYPLRHCRARSPAGFCSAKTKEYT